MNKKYILGIDTSNYKTSVAITDSEGIILCDLRRFLKVKQGEKGLRQSDALFQHVKNLPDLFEEVRNVYSGHFAAIAYSEKPRPVEGSYMPVFLAGESFARSLAAALDIPCFAFSHQEGHIEAVKAYSEIKCESHIMACHFSGGTTELLEVRENAEGYDIDIIGGSKDIAFGQVIDRAGNILGLDFPSGEVLDKIALQTMESSALLTPIKVHDGRLNLSGIDTQLKRHLECLDSEDSRNMLIRELFDKCAEAMVKMIVQGSEKTGINTVLMAGGVASSKYIRQIITKKLKKYDITAAFDDSGLSQDNAVGISLLGGKVYGSETR